MTTTIKMLIVLAAIFFLSSFKNKHANEFIGTYGVSSSDPAQIKLTISADYTFYYQDFSIPNKKIILKGNWIFNGEKLLLTDNHFAKNFHNVWTFDENGQVVKSRKGLTFYRLCKINS